MLDMNANNFVFKRCVYVCNAFQNPHRHTQIYIYISENAVVEVSEVVVSEQLISYIMGEHVTFRH